MKSWQVVSGCVGPKCWLQVVQIPRLGIEVFYEFGEGLTAPNTRMKSSLRLSNVSRNGSRSVGSIPRCSSS